MSSDDKGKLQYLDINDLIDATSVRTLTQEETATLKEIYASASPEAIRPSQLKPVEEYFSNYYGSGILQPPYDQYELLKVIENSSILAQCIEAYAINIGGFGYEILPRYDPDDPPPGVEEEKNRLEIFFEQAVFEDSFEILRAKLDRNRESTGQWYTEIIRTFSGEIAGIQPIRSYTMRLAGLSDPVRVTTTVVAPGTYEKIEIERYQRFRKFVQYEGGQTLTFFKQLGDPRHLNKYTGEWSDKPWKPEEEANEILFHPIYATWSEYGIPRWVPAMPEIVSLRSFSELVYLWFQRGCIGTYMMATTNARVINKEELQQKIDAYSRGLRKAFNILFVEAESGDLLDIDSDGGKGSIVLEDISQNLNYELITQYPPLGRATVLSVMRLPPIYVGESSDYNRATAEVAREIGENQVFWPERNLFDSKINTVLFPVMGIYYHTFRSKGARTKSMVEIAKASSWYWQTGVGTINAAIKMYNELTGFSLPTIDEPFGEMPLVLLNQGFFDPSVFKGKSKAEIHAILNDWANRTRERGMWADRDIIEKSTQKVDAWAEVVRGLHDQLVRGFKEAGINLPGGAL